MLLKHTTAGESERKALTINPAKTCQPIGAMYAALGIHGCMPHSHGSQGCCAYHRSSLTRHYKEPIMAGTSSFTEGTSVFGGQANLLQAFNNIFTIYDPDVVAVHSTCLSETIGDDLGQIAKKAFDEGKIPEGKTIIYAPTPSYVGSHVTGFSSMCKAMAAQLAEDAEVKNATINIVPGWVEPSDMREIKRLMKAMRVTNIMFPDTSDVLDAPMTGHHQFYPRGGVTVQELKDSGKSSKTFCLGAFGSEAAGEALWKKCRVPKEVMEMPIGIRATDRFLSAVSKETSCPVPQSITDERGRLVDMIADMQNYLSGKRVALYGDPDQLLSWTEFLIDMDMKPVYIVSGTPGKIFKAKMEKLVGDTVPECKYMNGERADMFRLHEWIKEEGVDLIIGNSYGKYISRDEGIPFIRTGFPIYDRVGHSYFPTVGYAGGMRIVEKILEAVMDVQDAQATEESFELVM